MEDQRKTLSPQDHLIGYALSRSEADCFRAWNVSTWEAAYSFASERLGTKPTSIKQLRDEFDALTDSPRKGWRNREPRAHILSVFDQFRSLTDSEVMELVSGALQGRDLDDVYQAISAASTMRDAASRLETGRRAESFFCENVHAILTPQAGRVIDLTSSGKGFDFALEGHPGVAIEVKGLVGPSGSLLFTDREYREAEIRQQNYWLCVVHSLDKVPSAKVLVNPASELKLRPIAPTMAQTRWACTFRTSG